MSATWGKQFKVTIFGESHGRGLGVVLDGLKAGFALDLKAIQKELQRRAPSNDDWSTSRKEKDKFEIYSGFHNKHTTGAPLMAFIANENQKSADYEKMKNIIRPSHADWSAQQKYQGWQDKRGGGYFSGRLTAALVFAGAVAKQYLLKKYNIKIAAFISSIGKIKEKDLDFNFSDEQLNAFLATNFPVKNPKLLKPMQDAIFKAKKDQDSIGGSIVVGALNVPAGWGEPFFAGIESKLASLFFAVPAVKGVEFGKGFAQSAMLGSEANDPWQIDKNLKLSSITNNNGGINGGISNGMPIWSHIAIKPTPSIGKMQRTVDYEKKEAVELKITGRHDPCIVPRVLPVLESAMAIGLLDEALINN